MKYWDYSAIVPLLVTEEASSRLERVLAKDPAVVTWWGTPVECASAVARLERDGALSAAGARQAADRLREGRLNWIEVPATSDVRDQAMRLLRVHSLRAPDALQLAAAIVASDFQPGALDFVTLDVRLADAVHREGFSVTGT